jgi:rhodanese-related sulfurtransferase/rubrerythrin
MRWKQFLTPVKSVDSEEAKDYMSKHEEGKFVLLDVRQPHEYEKEHIPGAKLVPLPELTDRFDELDKDEPTIVYCAVGGRSRMAAQLLSGKGFKNVMNLKGEIAAWQERKAIGPYEFEAIPFDQKASPQDIMPLAFGLELGLESFYLDLSSKAKDEDLASLFKKLASFEEKHKRKLFTLYSAIDPSGEDKESFEKNVTAEVLEGGFTTEEFIEKNRPALESIQDVINLAMMIETQALDLYSRYADKSQDKKSKEIFFQLAEDEKSHLKKLGELSEPRSLKTSAF